MGLSPEKENRLDRMRVAAVQIVLILIIATVVVDLLLVIGRSLGYMPEGSSIDLGVFVTEATLLATLLGAGSLIKVVGTK